MYDRNLGGMANFDAGREEAGRMLEICPALRRLARENRQFLRCAVHCLAAGCGILQFPDPGSGLPAARSTHQVAQGAAPDSTGGVCG